MIFYTIIIHVNHANKPTNQKKGACKCWRRQDMDDPSRNLASLSLTDGQDKDSEFSFMYRCVYFRFTNTKGCKCRFAHSKMSPAMVQNAIFIYFFTLAFFVCFLFHFVCFSFSVYIFIFFCFVLFFCFCLFVWCFFFFFFCSWVLNIGYIALQFQSFTCWIWLYGHLLGHGHS